MLVEVTRVGRSYRDVPVTVEVTRVVKERFEDEDGYILLLAIY